jgi:acyl-CoA synthetase (AMP-forming)/AMP-acid ligase II
MNTKTNYNIAQTLSDVAAKMPDETALISKKTFGYQTWSFRDLNGITDAYAHGLVDKGLRKGDRVILMVRPSMEFVCLAFALFKIGAVAILIDPGMGYKNLLRCIGSVEPSVFIGVPKAHLFKGLFPEPFARVKINICVGKSFGIFGMSLQRVANFSKGSFSCVDTANDDLAAIIFTTGSTGPPKGVQYEHGIFSAQLKLIRNYYGIGPGDIDQPAFPLFALFSTALGACAVIPDMNPAHPARVNPKKFIKTMHAYGVTYSFGSPAIWNVVSRYCLAKNIRLPSLKKVLMAGAPVQGELIERVTKIMAEMGGIHTPYGATESLPIVSMTGKEILGETWSKTKEGKGICVGRPLPEIDVNVIPISDAPIKDWHKVEFLPVGEIGEIIVKGDVVTKAYFHNDRENSLAKIQDNSAIWHRMGDVGYFDDKGRLWFCGRKGHRVVTEKETMFTIPCEAVFNEHPLVSRSALVGVGEEGRQMPVLIVEPCGKLRNRQQFLAELQEIGSRYEHTRQISRFLIHPAFPVDIRHNAKIFREKLAVWAAEKLKSKA